MECSSIVFACQRFHHYLYGRDSITAETDHKPLIAIFKKPLLCAHKRLQSIMLTLQHYNLNVVYRPGCVMYISDTLSRAMSDNVAPGGAHEHRTICLLQQEQNFFADINQAD